MTFGKVHPGSLRGSIFTLAGTAIGAGCLATPKVLQYLGVILGMGLIFGCAIVTRISMRTVIRASEESRIYLYPDLTKHILGPRWGNVLEGVIIVYVFGILVSY